MQPILTPRCTQEYGEFLRPRRRAMLIIMHRCHRLQCMGTRETVTVEMAWEKAQGLTAAAPGPLFRNHPDPPYPSTKIDRSWKGAADAGITKKVSANSATSVCIYTGRRRRSKAIEGNPRGFGTSLTRRNDEHHSNSNSDSRHENCRCRRKLRRTRNW